MKKLTLGIQKALHLHEDEAKKNPAHTGHTYAIYEKYDGWYMYIDCIDGQWQEISSRAHRALPSMAYYTKLFQTTVKPTKVDIRIVFEATIDEAVGVPMVFSKLNGLFNQKKTALKQGAIVSSKTFGNVVIDHAPVLRVHDLLKLDGPNKNFGTRSQMVFQFLDMAAQGSSNWLKEAELLCISDEPKDWYAAYEQVITKYDCKGEGVIGKRVDATYSPDKRNADLIKIKCEKTLELKVVGITEGEGKYVGMAGALIVVDANGIRNEVSGMSDFLRELWYKHPENIIGCIVEVVCMKVLDNKSLREGRFKDVRYDKSEIDTL